MIIKTLIFDSIISITLNHHNIPLRWRSVRIQGCLLGLGVGSKWSHLHHLLSRKIDQLRTVSLLIIGFRTFGVCHVPIVGGCWWTSTRWTLLCCRCGVLQVGRCGPWCTRHLASVCCCRDVDSHPWYVDSFVELMDTFFVISRLLLIGFSSSRALNRSEFLAELKYDTAHFWKCRQNEKS